MKLTMRPLQTEDDFWRIRNFLREIFLLNGRHELAWHVARLDYWRWHFVNNLEVCSSLKDVITIWEGAGGQIGAVLHPFTMSEAFLQVHPAHRHADLEDQMIAHAERVFGPADDHGNRSIFIMADASDSVRQSVLAGRGYLKRPQPIHRWWRELDDGLAGAVGVPGFDIRSMGAEDELSARSWASWQAFHQGEPAETYQDDGGAWFLNVQSAPLYRRDLDIVAEAPSGEIAAFSTIYFDDATRSAVCVLVGTVPEYQRLGLGKAVLAEGFRRLQQLGATRVFANGYDPPASALYRSALGRLSLSHSWQKQYRQPAMTQTS